MNHQLIATLTVQDVVCIFLILWIIVIHFLYMVERFYSKQLRLEKLEAAEILVGVLELLKKEGYKIEYKDQDEEVRISKYKLVKIEKTNS